MDVIPRNLSHDPGHWLEAGGMSIAAKSFKRHRVIAEARCTGTDPLVRHAACTVVAEDAAGGEAMRRKDEKNTGKSAQDKSSGKAGGRAASSRAKREDTENENPPRTTSKGWLTTPKFGSSTSGGGEIEPGPERD